VFYELRDQQLLVRILADYFHTHLHDTLAILGDMDAADRPHDRIPRHLTYDRGASPDLVAGLTVGVVALPLAMAFGIASGVTPQAGIYTAIVGGAIVRLLGGSRTRLAGPPAPSSSSSPASSLPTACRAC
jgi:MFS superfamily sulfate permease-like transporter